MIWTQHRLSGKLATSGTWPKPLQLPPVASLTLGVAVGSRQLLTDQLLSKPDVIRATHERVQLCQDPKTEFALRESLGVSRINHIHNPGGTKCCRGLRQDQAAVSRAALPGLTEDSMT